MKDEKKLKRIGNKSIILLGVIIISCLILFLSQNLKINTEEKNIVIEKNVENLNFSYSTTILIPAVDSSGEGIVTNLTVYLIPGSGRTLVDINQLLFWIDTQQSIQTAKHVAEKIVGLDLRNFDIVYSIENINASIVGGPSAGAALTIATIAAIQGKEIKKDVSITGTINPDGTIGPVGGIIPKANALKNAGIKIFLVPAGQGTQVNYVPYEECEKVGRFTFCRITYRKEVVNVGKSVGIEIVEVNNIKEALKYFGL
ncbi:MAG: S16 family serine protease [Nanopusillaceae archaeon]